mmetsp:Transcript_8976/g.33113  ORF Transcript_8976/g.33113 Transcript_8976/m.33113 type:complete len:81 (+) Transcript_8976:441-683(+)
MELGVLVAGTFDVAGLLFDGVDALLRLDNQKLGGVFGRGASEFLRGTFPPFSLYHDSRCGSAVASTLTTDTLRFGELDEG